VDIFFKTAKLLKVCNSAALLQAAYGQENARRIQHRLFVLQAMPTLAEVPKLPPERCHALKGDLRGYYAVDALHPFRIVFTPVTPLRGRASAAQLRLVTAITIHDIVDYH
jgi:proteic killer suppression protein